MTLPSSWQNLLLAALPESELAEISPRLEWVALPIGSLLYGSCEQLEQAKNDGLTH